MIQFSTFLRGATVRGAALAGLLALAACAQPLLANDASSGPGSNTAAASAVSGRATTGQFQ